jgi:hypothetical protein
MRLLRELCRVGDQGCQDFFAMLIPVVGPKMFSKMFVVERLAWQFVLYKEIVFVIATVVGQRRCVGEDGISSLSRVPT